MMSTSLRLSPNLCPSLTEEVYNKLLGENIKNGIDLLSRNPEDLAAKIRVSYKVIQNICKVVNAYHGSFIKSGAELYKEALGTSSILSTGFDSLDKILDGGLLTAELTEIFGLSGVGKTSICLSLSCQSALKRKENVLYLDPLHAINYVQVKNILSQTEGMEKGIEECVQKIHFLYPKIIWEVMQILEDLIKNGTDLLNQNSKYGLLVIDSLPSLIMPLIGSSYFEAFGVLNHLAKLLSKVVHLLKMKAVVVNSAIKNSFLPQSTHSYKPALGRYWMHVPHTRMFMERLNKSVDRKPDELATKPHDGAVNNQLVAVHITKSTRLKRKSCVLHL